jgi:hypothetical protein
MRDREHQFDHGVESFRLSRALEVLLAFVVLLELIAPFFAKSYGVDGPSQLNLIGEFTGLVSRGVLLPRWVPDGVFGFGIGSFYFYPPVAFYLSSVMRVVTCSTNVQFLYQMTGLIATILSFFAARPLLRSLGASNYSMNLGALLYAFAPFRIAEIYSRSSISSHVAYIFVPLVWYGLIAIIKSNGATRAKSILALGISSALLALSSVPLTLATALCVMIAGLAAWRMVTWRVVRDAALAALLAMGISAFHFSAVLAAKPYTQLGDLTVFDPEFIVTNILHGTNVPAIYHIGLLYLCWAILAVGYWNYRSGKERFSEPEQLMARIAFFIGIFIALLEIPPLSHPLWGMMQPFMLIQGCWRFYIHFVLMGMAAVAIAATPGMKRVAQAICCVFIVGAIGPVLLVIFNLHLYSHGNGPGGDPTEYLPIYTIHAQKVGFQVLREHASDSSILSDFQNDEHIEVGKPNPTSQNIIMSLNRIHLVTFHRFYWPYWHFYVNGNETPSHPDSIGRAAAMLPAGHYTATWQLERSPVEQTGIWISALTVAGIILWGVRGRHRLKIRDRRK